MTPFQLPAEADAVLAVPNQGRVMCALYDVTRGSFPEQHTWQSTDMDKNRGSLSLSEFSVGTETSVTVRKCWQSHSGRSWTHTVRSHRAAQRVHSLRCESVRQITEDPEGPVPSHAVLLHPGKNKRQNKKKTAAVHFICSARDVSRGVCVLFHPSARTKLSLTASPNGYSRATAGILQREEL